MDLVARVKLLDEQGERYSLAPIELKDILAPVGPLEAVVGLRLPFKSVQPGKYRLVIEIAGSSTSQSATTQTDIHLF
jgi:hypothetical protein